MSEVRPTIIRLREEIHAAMDIYKDRHRISKSALTEMALRDFFAKHEIPVEQPKADWWLMRERRAQNGSAI